MDFNDLQPLDQGIEPQTPSGVVSISVDPETESECDQSSGYDPDGSIREVEAQLQHQHQEYQGVTIKTPYYSIANESNLALFFPCTSVFLTFNTFS